MIKTVFFDIDNTLYNYDAMHEIGMKNLETYAKEKLNLEPSFMREHLEKVRKEIFSRLGNNNCAIHDRLIRFQCFLESLGISRPSVAIEMYHAYWGSMLKAMKPEEGVAELLCALKNKGIKLGIGTDLTAYIQYEKLKSLGILDEFSYIVSSEEAGVEKPSKEFFDLCLQKAGCKPKECIFIGDSMKKDVEGAIQARMHGVWYHPQETKITIYPRISSYLECVKKEKVVLGDCVI